MKKSFIFCLLALLFTIVSADQAYAQKKGKKKKSSKTDEYFDESGFANKLWYGGNFTLGYYGDQFESQFAFGITPMVGYKLIGEIVSVGPRVGFIYNHYRVKFGNVVFKASPVSYTAGVFARVKPIANLFGHFEYEYENAGIASIDQSGDTQIDRLARNNAYVGLGYTSGSTWGYEILVLYNVNQSNSTVESPFDIRFGITYKF